MRIPARVGHVKRAVPADGQSHWLVHPTFSDAGTAKGSQMPQISVEHLDALVTGVGDSEAATIVRFQMERANNN